MISACAVKYTADYYRPQAVGGKLVKGMEPHVPSIILFERDGVTIGLLTQYFEREIRVGMSFEVPEGKVVKLIDRTVEVKANGATYRPALSGTVWSGPGKTTDFPISGSMIGERKSYWASKGYGRTRNAPFFFHASFATMPQPASFQVKLPRFRINNTKVTLPVVRLTRTREDTWTSVP